MQNTYAGASSTHGKDSTAFWGEVASFNSFGQTPGGNVDRVGVKIFEDKDWQVYNLFPSGHLQVFHRKEINWQPINLPASWLRNTYTMLIVPSNGFLYIVGYDTLINSASGRSLSASELGFDLFQIDPKNENPLRLIASGIDLDGGIDSLVYGRITPTAVTVCAENKCADIDETGIIQYWALGGLQSFEFIEVAFDYKSAYAIVRKKWDDRVDGPINETNSAFYLASLKPYGVEYEIIRADGIPYFLQLNGGKPVWMTAKSRDEVQDLFVYEISRMRNRGLMDFGQNNLEGRVAWSQAYYLNGLITASDRYFSLFDPDLKTIFRERVSVELELIARLASDYYPGYHAKRYSVDREPLLFALHLGRIAQLLSRALEKEITSPATVEALDRLREDLLKLDRTVEQIKECRPGDVIGECITLFYKQNVPFWADGANVPFNYISGYVGGLLAVEDTPTGVEMSLKLMLPLSVETLVGLPKIWRYWWGWQEGWSYEDFVSLNTPAYQGNAAGQNLAHITYRSMDAATLLILHSRNSQSLSNSAIFHFKQLVAEGYLLPQLNEQLSESNHRANLNPLVVKRFSRSSQAWQIQSQVWALLDFVNQTDIKVN